MKNKENNNKLIFGMIALFTLIILMFLVAKYNTPYYKVESRKEKLIEEKKKRKETVLAWLRVQGTNIDYPIIYNSDEYDINKINDYDFLWNNAKSKVLRNAPTIFGHNIQNLSTTPSYDKEYGRFENLLNFVYSDFVTKNKYIQYTIDNKDYLYKIFSVSFIETKNLSYARYNLEKNELKSYIKGSIYDSIYKFDIDVDDSDKIISLVTCTRLLGNNTNYDFKIDARLVRKNENITNYSFKETKKYSKIKSILKGDGNNEKA